MLLRCHDADSEAFQGGLFTLSCPEANLVANEPWPDATGASIGIHDRNWQNWAQDATGLTAVGSSWQQVAP